MVSTRAGSEVKPEACAKSNPVATATDKRRTHHVERKAPTMSPLVIRIDTSDIALQATSRLATVSPMAYLHRDTI